MVICLKLNKADHRKGDANDGRSDVVGRLSR